MLTDEIRVIGQLRPLLRPFSGRMGVLAVIALAESILEVASITLLLPLLASLGDGVFAAAPAAWPIEWVRDLFAGVPGENRLAAVAATIFGLVLARSVLDYGSSRLAAGVDMDLDLRLRDLVLGRLLNMDLEQMEKMEPGATLNTLEEITATASSAAWTLFSLMVHVMMAAVFISVLLLLSWPLTLLSAFALAGVSWVIKRLTHRTEEVATAALASEQSMSQRALEIIKGMRTIRAFGQEDFERARFGKVSKELSHTGYELEKISSLMEPVAYLLVASLLVVVMVTTLQEPGNLPTFLVFVFILYRLQPQMVGLDEGRHELEEAAPSLRELVRVLEADVHTMQSGSRLFRGLDDAIRLRDVSFRYAEDQDWALRHVTLDIPRGERVALVGPSGAGKSTLINLLLRFHDPQEGTICADGLPLPDLDLRSWRSHLAIVSQDAHIFNDSLRHNIAYGLSDASGDDVIAAARAADAHDFITALPNGYDTIAGDQGAFLSGGQRQRIALARAIIRRADILILDEATNALDSLTEANVLDGLQSVQGECTVISVAHRLTTIEQADRIVVLESGRVKEQGTSAELLQNRDLFARLYQLQTAEGPADDVPAALS